MNTIIQGDCLESLKKLEDNSIDAIVTDPPYGLSFMGKRWDYDVPSVEIWEECLRVLKPGGYLLSFAGTRTQHRMAVRIEDAGFEIKDLIFWCYGQGFPKSQRIGCNCDRGMLQYTNETLSLSNNKEVLDLQAGFPLSEQVSSSEEQDLLKEVRGAFNIVEEKGGEEKTTSDLQTLQDRVLSEVDSKSQNNLLFTEVQRDSEVGTSKEVFSERIGNKESEEGIENGEEPSMERGSDLLEKKGELQTNKVCEMSEGISGNGEEGQLYNGTSFSNGDAHEKIINQNGSSASYQSRPTRQSDRESDVIPEQYTSQDIRRLCETCGGVIGAEGFGSALKPSLEPITMAKKPISEKNMRLNFLKWGVGGINIDESRVGFDKDNESFGKEVNDYGEKAGGQWQKGNQIRSVPPELGRFPANFIHDGSEEVVELFPETKSGGSIKKGTVLSNNINVMNSKALDHEWAGFQDSGSASRFFYCAKASKSERNKGLDSYVTVKYNGDICKEENMVVVQLLQKVILEQELVSFSTGESGESLMVQFPKDSSYTIKTTINKIMTSQILNLLMLSLTNESTQDVRLEKVNGGNLAENVESLKKWILTITNDNQELALGVSRVALQMLLQINNEENWKEATNFHSTVKPISLMEYLVKLVSKEGHTILDPFAGSGSTLIACKKLKRNYIGMELDPEYIKIAEARLNAIKEENTLF